MGDDEHAAPAGGSVGEHAVEHLVGQRGVEPAGRLVEDKDRTRGQQGAGHGQAPPFAAGQGDAVLAHRRLEAVGECGDPGRQADDLQRVGDRLVGGVGPAEDEVGPHRAGEQLRPLVGERAGGAGVDLTQVA